MGYRNIGFAPSPKAQSESDEPTKLVIGKPRDGKLIDIGAFYIVEMLRAAQKGGIDSVSDAAGMVASRLYPDTLGRHINQAEYDLLVHLFCSFERVVCERATIHNRGN
jgi:hypothetical protein